MQTVNRDQSSFLASLLAGFNKTLTKKIVGG